MINDQRSLQKAFRARLLAAAGIACLPMAGLTQAPLFNVPLGCEAFLTVQSRSCLVSHYWTCEATPGDRWRIDYVAEGPAFLSVIDNDAQWLESGDPADARRTVTILPADDPGSVTELLDTGVDSYDFVQRRPSGQIERIVGFDRITGDPVVIDGEELFPTEFNATFRDVNGRVLLDVKGQEFVSARFRRFFGGITVSDDDGVITQRDRTPVEFIEPGEPGFLSTLPQYDCDLVSGDFALDVEDKG